MKLKSAALEELCKEMAPELADVPLYIVYSSTLPPPLAAADEYLGATSPTLDLCLREHLHPWRGRGPAILLNDSGLRAEARELVSILGYQGPLTQHREFIWCAAKIVTHELAHVLDRRAPYYRVVDAADPAPAPPLELVGEVLSRRPEEIRPREIPSWHGHGVNWLRIVLHLRWRAERLRFKFSAYNLIDHDQLGLSPGDAYRHMLGDEPEQMEAERFETILATPLPPAFASLWARDTEIWRQRRQEEQQDQQSCVAVA